MTLATSTETAQRHWEESTYPSASQEMHLWMREQRGAIRAFLNSPFGRTEATRSGRRPQKKKAAN